MISTILNALIFALEIIFLAKEFPKLKWNAFIYYTILSNICAGISSAMYLLLGSSNIVVQAFRYNTTCMLTLTCLVAIFILIPTGDGGIAGVLWHHSGLIFHLIAPVLSFVSFCFFETQLKFIYVIVPMVVTIVYGIVILILNFVNVVDGPYPFIKVKSQSITASILWLTAIVLITFGVSVLVILL